LAICLDLQGQRGEAEEERTGNSAWSDAVPAVLQAQQCVRERRANAEVSTGGQASSDVKYRKAGGTEQNRFDYVR